MNNLIAILFEISEGVNYWKGIFIIIFFLYIYKFISAQHIVLN